MEDIILTKKLDNIDLIYVVKAFKNSYKLFIYLNWDLVPNFIENLDGITPSKIWLDLDQPKLMGVLSTLPQISKADLDLL